MPKKQHLYLGFWGRLGAGIIDGLVLLIPLMIVVAVLDPGDTGIGDAISFVVTGAYFVLMFHYKHATVGLMALDTEIQTAKGKKPGVGRLIGWYFARILSAIILGIGFFMIGWTEKKQGLHDKITGLVFVRK